MATALLTGGGRVAMMVDGGAGCQAAVSCVRKAASPIQTDRSSALSGQGTEQQPRQPLQQQQYHRQQWQRASNRLPNSRQLPPRSASPFTSPALSPTPSCASAPPELDPLAYVPPTQLPPTAAKTTPGPQSTPLDETSLLPADGGRGRDEVTLVSGTAPQVGGGVTAGGASRWSKLRTTVQISGAINVGSQRSKPPLKREDSFLQRFSTRHIGEQQDADGNPVSEGTVPTKRTRLLSQATCSQLLFGVINPDENALFLWLWVLTICVLYNAWALILRQTFTEIQNISVHMWIAFDGFSDLVYLLDIAIQFRTGYLEQGLMVCDASKLAGHYLRSRSFLMDIVALTPLDLLQLRFGFAPLLRFPRFIKVYRCYRFYYMVESRTIYPNLWRVANLIHILLLLSHWFGCFHYILSEFEDFRGAWAYTNPHKANNSEWRAITRKYVASVYWSTLTLTTIGGDHVTPSSNLQYAFTILSYLIGVFIFATIVGQVGNVITNRNASRLEFERLLDGAKLYMRHHKVPHQMQRRVQRWYDYSWSRGRMRGGGDINSALGSLPDKLKTELALHVNLKTLKKVTIFQECQPEFLHDLVLKMRAYIFTPGDLICRKGEVAREMFIIADGILEVISETGKVLTQMKAGDFFGEIGILNLDGFNRRTADVRSVGYSELFSLSREDVLSAMKDYPEAQEILQAMGRKRLMEARLAAANCVNTSQTNTTSNTTFKQQELNRQFQGNAGTLSGLGTVDSVAPTGAGSSQGSTQSVRSLSTHGPRSMDTIRKLRKDLKYLFRSRTLAPNASSCCTAENASIRPGFGNTYQHSSGPHSQQQPQQLQYHSHGSSAVASSGPTGMNKSITRLLSESSNRPQSTHRDCSLLTTYKESTFGGSLEDTFQRRFHVENFRQTSTGGINSINPPTAPCKGQTTEEFRYGDEGVAEGGPLSPPIASGRGVPQPSQQPLGAGLSLLERIKLLKEVERQRKSSTASSLSLTQSMGSGAVGNIAPISSVPSASTAGSALASSVSVSATAPLTSISIATAMTTSSSATAAVAAVPVGHNHQQQQQQQMTTTRIPVHSLRHCHPATGRSPRSELLLLPQQPTTGSRATLSVGTGQLEARRYSATPPSSLPLLHSHVPKFQSHTHGHHLHGQQQLYALADVPLTPDQSSVHSRPQRIVENLRRATMVSATFEASSPPPLNDAASGTEVPLLRRVLMLKRRASDENSRAASRPESLQLTEVPPAQLNVCSVGSGSRGRMSLAKVSPRTETTVNEWLASSSAKSSSVDISQTEVTDVNSSQTCGQPATQQLGSNREMTQDLADLSRPQSGAGDASSAIRAPHHNSRNSGNGINRRRSNGDDGGSSSSLQPLTAETDEVSGSHSTFRTLLVQQRHQFSTATSTTISSTSTRRTSSRSITMMTMAIEGSDGGGHSTVPVAAVMQMPVLEVGAATRVIGQQSDHGCVVIPNPVVSTANTPSTTSAVANTTSPSFNGNLPSPSLIASPHKRALWRRATREGYAMRRAVLKRMCAIEQAPSPNEDQSPTLRQLQQTTQLLSGAGGGQPLPQDVRQQATPNNQGITTRVTSSEDTYVKGDLPREKAVTQPTLKAVPFETGQIIIADPDNVEVMVASAMKQIKLAVTEYLRDTHMELTSRVEALENELERKDSIISELQDELVYKERELRQQQFNTSFIGDLCSLSDSSFDSEAEDGALLLAATPKSESPATDAPEIGPNGLISSNHHCCEQHQQCSEHYYGTTTAGLGHVDTITSVSAEHLAQQLSETYTCLQIPSTASEGFDLSSRNSWPKLGGQGSSPAFDEDTAGMDGACCGELSASWHDHLDATQDPLALGAGTSMDPGQPSHVGMVVASKIGPDDLWKLEFPQSFDISSKTPSFDRGSRISVNNSTHDVGQAERGQIADEKDNKDTTTVIRGQQRDTRYRPSNVSASSIQLPVSVRKQFTLSRDGNVQQSSDDWEVKMLVEQFDAKMKKRSLEGRRHSSCDIQSWDRLILQAETSSNAGAIRDIAAGNSQQSTDIARRRYGRSSRMFLSRVAGVCTELGTSRRAEIRRASLARFASVDVPSLTENQKPPSDEHCLSSWTNSSSVRVDSLDPPLPRSEVNVTSPPRQPVLNLGLTPSTNAARESASRTIPPPLNSQQQQPSHQFLTGASHDALVATFRRRTYAQSRFNSMVVGETATVDTSSPTEPMLASSRSRPPQWKSLDEEAKHKSQSSAALSDTDFWLENARDSVDSRDKLPQSESANDLPPWSPIPHPPAQAIGLPTIREGSRLIDQKSEMSDEEDNDSSSTRTTVYIDIDSASPEICRSDVEKC
ncbi:uncharacterized protein LOC111246593 isoform X4 [Varroa destructor]|uniref:Cyclic nucleotide-binding domain-containing protein n=1 Tax=Varroa destructor TaxID=109461 RepID=A0A7M7JHU3_VARDE|nr:uncharacterized protein LOC111246593 isoform X4 [Varroa destructor]